MASILPERFDKGDFALWLRQYECCAVANGWTDEQKLAKLPAFLRGLAATHYFSFEEEQRDTYGHLIINLKAALCPQINREGFYREFEDRLLRHNEDPAIYLWSLQEILRKAAPDLDAEAFDALLSRQFMRGIPEQMKFKLLEQNPIPTLVEMVAFCKHFIAIRADKISKEAEQPLASFSAGISCVDSVPKSQQSLLEKDSAIDRLTTVVEKMAVQQQSLVATLQDRPPYSALRPAKISQVQCFFCGKMGHIARKCPEKQGEKMMMVKKEQEQSSRPKCTLCQGTGHFASQCANNWTTNKNFRNQSDVVDVSVPLNYQGVPHQ
eukprot:Seg2556.4 transcript_id=Seg2556.4/GoldUCD/mRNA.D3Y31 product="hypothetical protein" protein_id=Seg2556.4/GoldUCD/D3Y31